MFNRTEILKAAWTQCKAWYLHRGRKFVFVKAEFQWSLRCAWKAARQALQTATERRVDAIHEEIAMLTYKPARVNIETRRLALQAELAALA